MPAHDGPTSNGALRAPQAAPMSPTLVSAPSVRSSHAVIENVDRRSMVSNLDLLITGVDFEKRTIEGFYSSRKLSHMPGHVEQPNNLQMKRSPAMRKKPVALKLSRSNHRFGEVYAEQLCSPTVQLERSPVVRRITMEWNPGHPEQLNNSPLRHCPAIQRKPVGWKPSEPRQDFNRVYADQSLSPTLELKRSPAVRRKSVGSKSSGSSQESSESTQESREATSPPTVQLKPSLAVPRKLVGPRVSKFKEHLDEDGPFSSTEQAGPAVSPTERSGAIRWRELLTRVGYGL